MNVWRDVQALSNYGLWYLCQQSKQRELVPEMKPYILGRLADHHHGSIQVAMIKSRAMPSSPCMYLQRYRQLSTGRDL